MRPTMSGTVRLGSVRGIPIRVHFTLLIVLPLFAALFSRAFVAAAEWAGVPPERVSGAPFLWGLLVAVGLFVSVLIHELAHSLYALRRGVQIRDITLLALGGASHMEEAPQRPRDEAVMALVGPLTSLLLAAALFGGAAAAEGSRSFNFQFAVFHLGLLNLFLGVFNLLPAFPMDGGRILRALLTRRMGRVRATQAAARVGKGFAVLFGLWGFLSLNFILLLIAFFVFIGAQAESQQVLLRAAVGRMKVGELMSPRLTAVDADASLAHALATMRAERREALPVLSNGAVLGAVTFTSLQATPAAQRPERPVRDVLQPLQTVSPSEHAWDAIRRMTEERLRLLAVVEDGRLVGTLDPLDVTQGLAVSEVGLPPLEAASRKGWSLWRREERPA